MKQFTAALLETQTVAPGLVRAVLSGEAMPPSRPGQFFLARPVTETLDPYLRRVWYAPQMRDGRAEFWLDAEVEHPWFDLVGPLGRGLRRNAERPHVLAVAENAQAAAPLLGFLGQTLEAGQEIALICGEPRLPEFLLPIQAEYVIGTVSQPQAVSILQGAGQDAWQWADALVGAGSLGFCHGLAGLARQEGKLTPAGASSSDRPQVLLVDRAIIVPCGVGACYLCQIETRAGLRWVCRDGPVFDLGLF